MRILAALLLGYNLLIGRVGAEVVGGSGKAPEMPSGMTSSAKTEMDRAIGAMLEREDQQGRGTDAPQRRVSHGRVVYIARGCSSVQKDFDILVHLHGAPTAMEPAFDHSGIDGVLVMLNYGIGSGAYEDAFQMPRSFPDFLASVNQEIRDMCPAAAGFRRIALSGWSAGYGGVWRIIDRSANADRVDAVLLSDGLHAGFEPDKERQRVVNGAQMAAYTLFADRAVNGEKLFAITHSSIVTPYASTTETSSYLLQQENLQRTPVAEPGPRPNMLLTSRADRGHFHVRGYAGNDKPDHCDHLHAIGDTLLPYLRERWAR